VDVVNMYKQNSEDPQYILIVEQFLEE